MHFRSERSLALSVWLVVILAGCAMQPQDRTELVTTVSADSAIFSEPSQTYENREVQQRVIAGDESMRRRAVRESAGFAVEAAMPMELELAMVAADVDSPGPNEMLAHFINVGQGAATLLEFPCGLVLVDTGGETNSDGVMGREELVNYLVDVLDRRTDLDGTLDSIILTHAHKDHTDGVHSILEEGFKVRNVVDNGLRTGSGKHGQIELQDLAADEQLGYEAVEQEEILFLTGLTNPVIDPLGCGEVDPIITALWGEVDLSGQSWDENGNNDSVVVRVDFGESSFLIPGDLEEDGIKEMLWTYSEDLSAFDVDVYQLGHHGSRNGTTEALVCAMSPAIAVIPVGNPNLSTATFSAFSFGHPNRVAVGHLTSGPCPLTEMRDEPITVPLGIKGRNPSTGAPPEFEQKEISHAIYATGWDGHVVIRADAQGDMSVIIE